MELRVTGVDAGRFGVFATFCADGGTAPTKVLVSCTASSRSVDHAVRRTDFEPSSPRPTVA
jgi:hypothetical protein